MPTTIGAGSRRGADRDGRWMHVLTKPFDADQLRRSIEAALAAPD